MKPQSLERTETDPLSRIGTAQSFYPGQQICQQDDDHVAIYRMVSGLACSTKLLADGRRQIVRFLNKGDYFGFEECAALHLGVDAITDVVVARYKTRQVAELAEADRSVGRLLAGIASAELVKAYDRVVLLGRRTATEKVAWFLLQLAALPGHDGSITIAMSRTDIADYLGLTPETVCRALSYFGELGAIRLTDPHLMRLVDRAQLEDLADGVPTSPSWLGIHKRPGRAADGRFAYAVPA